MDYCTFKFEFPFSCADPDAQDGLFAVTEAYPEVVFPRVTVLTPNVVEMDRLAQKVAGKETLGKDEVYGSSVCDHLGFKEDYGSFQITNTVAEVVRKLGVSIVVKGGEDRLFVPGDERGELR